MECPWFVSFGSSTRTSSTSAGRLAPLKTPKLAAFPVTEARFCDIVALLLTRAMARFFVVLT